MAEGLTIRLHVSEQERKVWGEFNVGIAHGYLLFSQSTNEIADNIPVEFQWRGRENNTGSAMNGSGEMTVQTHKKLRGVFHDMAGEIDFEGKRVFMPSGISDRDLSFYSFGWEEYRYSSNSRFYGRRW